MKVLIVYYSQTGNTEKVARAIQEESSLAHETRLQAVESTDPSSVGAYDFIFVGSPMHAGGLAAPVQKFLDAMQVNTGQKLACFITHAAPAYPDQEMDRFIDPVRSACESNGLDFAGYFDCQGYLTDALHEMIKNRQGVTDEEWARRVEAMRPHPDDEDLNQARSFAREVLS